MAKPVIHHRTKEFRAILKEIFEGLQYLFQTANPVIMFSASGTGAMEAAVVNTLSQGDRALVVRGGKFGERWGELCEAYGVDVVPIDIEWGYGVDPSKIDSALKKDPDIKAVFTTLCETSTCVCNDIKAVGEVVASHSAILVVDAISGLGAEEFKTDEWLVDIAVTGSQKALMLPPGLSFASLSPKAQELMKRSTLPKYYLSFEKKRSRAWARTTRRSPRPFRSSTA
jgi:aspartate aminotransferase-like enzyme